MAAPVVVSAPSRRCGAFSDQMDCQVDTWLFPIVGCSDKGNTMMRFGNRLSVANVLTVVVILITFGLPIWQAFTQYGWFGVTFGRQAPLFWGLALVWAIGVVCVIRWERRWWILLGAPSVVYPVVLWCAFVAACLFGGSCL